MTWALLVIGLYIGVIALTVGIGMAILVASRERPWRPDRAALAVFTREVAAHALFMAMHPLGWVQLSPRPFLPIQEVRTPVLLVPGFAMNRSCMAFLALALRRRGWRWVWSINNRAVGGPRGVASFASHLEAQVDLLRRVSGSERVDLVCHSMGGLVAAHALQHGQLAGKVRRVVTLGTPYLGTQMAAFGFWLPEHRDLFPRSDILQRLEDNPAPTTAIWSTSDHLVVPSGRAEPDWVRHGPHRSWQLESLGHLEMLTSARVFGAVKLALLGEDATDADAVTPSLIAWAGEPGVA
jgi:triacylglycerol lipase